MDRLLINTAMELGFKYIGYSLSIPLAFLLILLASVSAIDDIRVYLRRGIKK